MMLSPCPNMMGQSRYRLVFWNVENLFDTWDDSTRNDDAFTPTGDHRWTVRRYRDKLNKICKVVTALGESADSCLSPLKDVGRFEAPLVVALAEVESDKALRDLCKGTPLRKFGYEVVHFDSPDVRGIDNAILYRRDLFSPFLCRPLAVSDSSAGFLTRDILLVEGTTREGDTLIVVVNHFPSKRGGADSERRRRHVAKHLRLAMDTLSASHPSAAIVVMGDFNAAPDEEVIRKVLLAGSDYVNLMDSLQPGRGTYNYQGHWTCLDQIMVPKRMIERDGSLPGALAVCRCGGRVFNAPFLLVDDGKYLGQKVNRTYSGVKYLGGYSDHLPVYVDLVK